ncbi:MAG: trypsin-like peptidase domain-containing protein [Bdellovibrionales bacterium]|nr:trypsin-like peptidase domain-containing protein [Bdellovibrionales bacterium]
MTTQLSLLPLLLVVSFNAQALGMNVIYGGDDRADYYQISNSAVRKRADATVALMRAATLRVSGETTYITTNPFGQSFGLCASEPFYNQETAAYCSGFLIAPDTVVTAGHCVRNEASCNNTRFVFGFAMPNSQNVPRTVPSAMVFSCKQLVHSVSYAQGEDFAVVRLDRPVTHVAPLSFRTQGSVSVGEDLMVIGYPLGLPVKIAGGAQVREVRNEHMVANLDTYGGNSGSAVFNSVTGAVEGVLVRGEMDWDIENGCRISKRCSNNGCRGEDITLIERVLPYLNN